MTEIVYIKSKAYSYLRLSNLLNEIKKLKGIGKTTIDKKIKFEDYKDCLFNSTIKMNSMYTMNSEKHNLHINEVNKISMGPFDDKRYIRDNGIITVPWRRKSQYFI